MNRLENKDLENKKKKKEQGIAVFEIFLMIISIGAFAYFVGEEFQVVGAVDSGASSGTGDTTTRTGDQGVSSSVETAVAAAAGVGISSVTTPASKAVIDSITGGGLTHTPVTAEEMAKATAGLTKISKTTGLNWGNFQFTLQNGWFSIIVNAGIALGIYFVTKTIGSWLAPDSPKLFDYLAVGAGAGYGLSAIFGTIFFPSESTLFGVPGMGFGLIGIGIGIIVAMIFYKEEYIVAVQFSCLPWQPEKGGARCDECNKGALGCTAYKCESLGQSCELLNPNTDRQICYWVNRNNIAPPTISAWDGPLDSEKYEYIPDGARLPPDKGVIIKDKRTADGCIIPFSTVNFGITLDIPGSCKVDVQRKNNYSEMNNPGYISQGYYLYNHTMTIVPSGINASNPYDIVTQTGGTYEIFVRCESKEGYSNAGTFVFKYCVQSEPDITAPLISAADPVSGMPFEFGQTSKKVYIYVDKPSECRWSHNDEDFDVMEGTMTGPKDVTGISSNMLYTYKAELTGLKDGVENKFYFRCKSYPSKDDADRVKNEESYVYTLVGTRLLVFDSLSPEVGAVIKDSTENVKVTLEAKTSAGYKDGEAYCYFKKTSEDDKNYVIFMNTNSYQSTQDLWLSTGDYDYSVKCCDLGGNCETKTTQFEVDTDFQSSIVVRAYNEAGSLKIVTNEDAECVYDKTSCSYNFEDGLDMTSIDGINHFTEWDTNSNFYIKCRDAFGNEPAPDACSIVIRPFTSY
jgi:hypothetical protein